jgi:hypothetical protein
MRALHFATKVFIFPPQEAQENGRVKHDLSKVRLALEDFIRGVEVHRAKLQLTLDGQDLTKEFVQALLKLGYIPAEVRDVGVRPGQRAPAFLIQDATAYFGWVFWEKFTEKKMRKLWGSVIRNEEGDWEIQLPAGRTACIYVNEKARLEMDLDRPA